MDGKWLELSYSVCYHDSPSVLFKELVLQLFFQNVQSISIACNHRAVAETGRVSSKHSFPLLVLHSFCFLSSACGYDGWAVGA